MQKPDSGKDERLPQIFDIKAHRVLYQPDSHTRLAHVAVVTNLGSRDEQPHEQGLAHFLEHMAFKGTTRRKAFHVLNRIDSVGGELNAYTTREKTVFHATVAAEHFERAFELLTDITFNAQYPQHEVVKERQVVAEEIDMYADSPEDVIFDEFEYRLFPRHALGWPILGTKQHLQDFTTESLQAFTKRHYGANRMVFAVAGNVSEKKMVRIAEKHLAPHALPPSSLQRTTPKALRRFEHAHDRNLQQAHVIIGGRAMARRTPDYAGFLMLNNILGGNSMNNRLSLNIREKYGLAYNLYSFYTPYTDTGYWGVYAGCEARNLERASRLIRKELAKMVDTTLTDRKLEAAKRQFIGSLLISRESRPLRLLGYAKDLLDFNKMSTIEYAIDVLEALTAPQLRDIAERWMAPHKQSELLLVPEED